MDATVLYWTVCARQGYYCFSVNVFILPGQCLLNHTL